jgi:hypothetical protein
MAAVEAAHVSAAGMYATKTAASTETTAVAATEATPMSAAKSAGVATTAAVASALGPEWDREDQSKRRDGE